MPKKAVVNLVCRTCAKQYIHPRDEVLQHTGTWPLQCPACVAAQAPLLSVIQALLENHTRLVASGDCGNWDVETEPEVVQARAAIAAATGGK